MEPAVEHTRTNAIGSGQFECTQLNSSYTGRLLLQTDMEELMKCITRAGPFTNTNGPILTEASRAATRLFGPSEKLDRDSDSF
jgi:hypothetical protein